MKTSFLFLIAITALTVSAHENTELSDLIINLERAALDRWINGDVYGFLELSADDVVYFDPMLERRLDGLDKLTEYYLPFHGVLSGDGYELINPNVQAVENMAVLTFNLHSYSNGKIYKWNCTEVYRKEKDGNWKIIQSHWSVTKPELK
jgi:ketosteroid isomerase-like protein